MKDIKLLNGNLKFTPERLTEFYQPSGAPGASGMGALSTDDEEDMELRKKKHSDLDGKVVIGQNQRAYDTPVGLMAPNKPVAGGQGEFYGSDPFDPSLNKDEIGPDNPNLYGTDFRFAKQNRISGGYNINQVVDRLHKKYGIDITKNQKALDSVPFALEYQRSKAVKFDQDQSLDQVVANLAKDPEYYTNLDNIIVGDGQESKKDYPPDDDYENVKAYNNNIESWWPSDANEPVGKKPEPQENIDEVRRGLPGEYDPDQPHDTHEPLSPKFHMPAKGEKIKIVPKKDPSDPHIEIPTKDIKIGPNEGSIMGDPDDPRNRKYMKGRRWTTSLKENEEEEKGTSHFVKHWSELDPEAQKDILKKKAEKPETTFFQKYPEITHHEKIRKSQEAPTGRPATPEDYDKPTEPIDEIAADGAPGGFGGTLSYAAPWRTPDSFTTNQTSKFKNSPTDGQDDENSHVVPQDSHGPLEDNHWDEYAASVDRPTFTDNLEEEKVDEMWMDSSATKVNKGWPVNRFSKLPDTRARDKKKKIKEVLYYGSQHSSEDWEKFKERVKNMSHEERQAEMLKFLQAGKAMGSKHKDIAKSHESPPPVSGIDQTQKPEEPIDEYFYYYYDPKLGKKVKKQSVPGMSSPVFDAPMPPQEPGEKEKPSKGKVLPLQVGDPEKGEYEPGIPQEVPIKHIGKNLHEAIENPIYMNNEVNSATLNADLYAQNMMEKINRLLEEKEQTDETAMVGDSLAITNHDLEEISTLPEPEEDPEKGKKIYMGKESEPHEPIVHLPGRKFAPEKGNVPIITEPPIPFPWFGKNEAKLDKPKRLPYTLYKEPTGLEKFVSPEETAADFIRKVLKGEPEEAQKLKVYAGRKIPHTFDPGKKLKIPIKKKEELANESFKRFIDVVKNSKILG